MKKGIILLQKKNKKILKYLFSFININDKFEIEEKKKKKKTNLCYIYVNKEASPKKK